MQINDNNLRPSVRTQNTDTSPSRLGKETEIVCLFLALSDPNKALMMRLLRAVVAGDVAALEALKADSPAASTPILDSFISDMEGAQL